MEHPVQVAARRTLEVGSGRIDFLGRVSDDSTVMAGTAWFDVGRRRVRLEQRFAVSDLEVTPLHTSIVDGDRLLIEEPDIGEWSEVAAPWPSGSPLALVFWLLSAAAENTVRKAGADPIWEVILTERDILAIDDEEGLRAGLAESLGQAGVAGTGASWTAEVAVDTQGYLKGFRVELPGDDPLIMDLQFSDRGTTYAIDIPPISTKRTPDEVVARAVERAEREEEL